MGKNDLFRITRVISLSKFRLGYKFCQRINWLPHRGDLEFNTKEICFSNFYFRDNLTRISRTGNAKQGVKTCRLNIPRRIRETLGSSRTKKLTWENDLT